MTHLSYPAFLRWYFRALFCTISITASAQITAGRIAYRVEIIMDGVNLDSVRAVPDTFDAFTARIMRRYIDTMPADPDLVYYFQEDKSREIRKGEKLDEIFHLHDHAALTLYTHRLKNGKVKRDTAIMDYRANPLWQVEYAITEQRDIRKQILGYDCFRIEVVEKRTIEGRGDFERYFALFVTDSIRFPAWLPCAMHAPRVDWCALEAVLVESGTPNLVTRMTAVSVAAGGDPVFFAIPERLR